jgi:mono/diheme cytochrome c family protein
MRLCGKKGRVIVSHRRLRDFCSRVGLLAAALVAAPALGDDVRARNNYLLHCMGCHGETGHGLEGKVPSMHDTLAMLSRSADGRYYVLRVPGVTQSTLSDEDLAAVLNWSLREFSDAGPLENVPPFTSAEVAEARTQPLLDVMATRERALGVDSGH